LAQRPLEVPARNPPRRQDRHHNARKNRYRRGEREYTRVDCDLIHAGEIDRRGSHEQVKRRPGDG